MTFLEKLEQEHPEFIGDRYPGGVALCPEDVGYEEKSPCPFSTMVASEANINCYACWRREMEEGS